MSLWLSIALQAAEAAPVAKLFDLARTTKPIRLNALAKCDDTLTADEIVVCAKAGSIPAAAARGARARCGCCARGGGEWPERHHPIGSVRNLRRGAAVQ